MLFLLVVLFFTGAWAEAGFSGSHLRYHIPKIALSGDHWTLAPTLSIHPGLIITLTGSKQVPRASIFMSLLSQASVSEFSSVQIKSPLADPFSESRKSPSHLHANSPRLTRGSHCCMAAQPAHPALPLSQL